PGVLMLNASSFQRRAPGFGWKWFTPGETLPLVGDAARLVNGMMELHIHPETGGISALRLHNRRGNVLSQRLVLLPPIEKGYAIHDENQIALDKIEQGPGDGDRLSVVAHSRVVDRQGNALAHLRQTTS